MVDLVRGMWPGRHGQSSALPRSFLVMLGGWVRWDSARHHPFRNIRGKGWGTGLEPIFHGSTEDLGLQCWSYS